MTADRRNRLYAFMKSGEVRKTLQRLESAPGQVLGVSEHGSFFIAKLAFGMDRSYEYFSVQEVREVAPAFIEAEQVKEHLGKRETGMLLRIEE